MSFSSFLSQNLQNYSVSREESPMFAFYELDSPAPYNICCLLIILFLLCLLFPALVYPPLCFSFLMVWSPVLHLLSTSMLFCMLVLIFFCLWDYTLVTDLSGAWKEGMCLDSQNEENIISKSRFPYADYWGRKSFKALFLNFPFCGLSCCFQYQKRLACLLCLHHCCWCAVSMVYSNVIPQAQEHVTMVVF